MDPCLFLHKDIILVLHVDECLLFAKSGLVLDSFLASLQEHFKHTSEIEVGAFLGIDIKRKAQGFIELTQPGLIGIIMQACGLERSIMILWQ